MSLEAKRRCGEQWGGARYSLRLLSCSGRSAPSRHVLRKRARQLPTHPATVTVRQEVSYTGSGAQQALQTDSVGTRPPWRCMETVSESLAKHKGRERERERGCHRPTRFRERSAGSGGSIVRPVQALFFVFFSEFGGWRLGIFCVNSVPGSPIYCISY